MLNLNREPGPAPEVTAATYAGGYRVALEFRDGLRAVVDLEPALWGPVFEPLHDPKVFAEFRLAGGTIEWACGADFAPEYLYSAAAGQCFPDSRCEALPCE